MSGYRYREAGPEDCPAVYGLICQLETSRLDRERFLDIFQAQLADGRYCCLVCCREDQVIGLLNLRMEDQLHHAGKIAEILELMVAPGHRGEGVGRRLVELACRRAEAAGCLLMEVAANRRRADAQAFYRKMGMTGGHLRFEKALRPGPEDNFDEKAAKGGC